MQKFLLNAIQNPKTSFYGLLALAGAFATLFSVLAAFFHALATADLNTAMATLQPLAVAFGLVGAGLAGLSAKDARVTDRMDSTVIAATIARHPESVNPPAPPAPGGADLGIATKIESGKL